MSKRKSWYTVNSSSLKQKLLAGQKIHLTTEYNNNHKTVYTINGVRLHTNSVKFALKSLNNGNHVDYAFLMANRSYDKFIYYTAEHGLLSKRV